MTTTQEEPASQTPPKNNKNDPLLTSIRHLVTLTNASLSTIEQSTLSSSTSLVSRLSSFSSQIRHFATRAISTYDHRGYYGPQICLGAALLLGSVAGIRRGKWAGLAAGGLGGVLAFENVYGLDSIGGYGSSSSWRDKMERSDDGER
jgi:hypothetical protein